jgi:hypothetical protein
MEKPQSSIQLGKGIVAALLALVVVAVSLPNMKQMVFDHSTSPPTYHWESRPIACSILIAAAFVPVFCILFLGRRRRRIEVVAWCFLVYLVIASFIH